MNDKIVTGTIKNMETGDTYEMDPFYMFCGGFELNTFVKIINVESFYHPEDNSRQISVDCLSLDSAGFVFKLELNFTPECIDDERKITSDITAGKILAVHGFYTIQSDQKISIMLHDPAYSQLPPEYSIEEIEEVFRVNSSSLIKAV